MEYHVFSPYSLCPLGAHVDHQHGIVTGFALDKGIDIDFSVTADGLVDMESTSFVEKITLSVSAPVGALEHNWGDYLRGAVWAMQQRYSLTVGIRGVVRGSMPSGGIASSAALLCGFIMALAKVNHINLERMQVVELAAQAERGYVGLNSGLLDHACVTLSHQNQLLFLDTDKSYTQLEPFGGVVSDEDELPFKVAIFFSGITRSLTYTNYNLRVKECCTAADFLMAYEDNHADYEERILRRVQPATFEEYVSKMPPRYARRARHFFSECERVKEGLDAWQQGDIDEFGELMFESCESSILNYECGSPQLIAIYRSLRNIPGVYGARFCGAGFIGSCFALIDPADEDIIREQVTRDYLSQFPMYEDAFRTFICDTHEGVAFVE